MSIPRWLQTCLLRKSCSAPTSDDEDEKNTRADEEECPCTYSTIDIQCWRGGNMLIELHYGDARVLLVNGNCQVGREDHSDRMSLMRIFRWLEHSFDGLHSASVLCFADDKNRSVLTKHWWTLLSLFVAKQTRFHGESSFSVSFALRFDQHRR